VKEPVKCLAGDQKQKVQHQACGTTCDIKQLERHGISSFKKHGIMGKNTALSRHMGLD